MGRPEHQGCPEGRSSWSRAWKNEEDAGRSADGDEVRAFRQNRRAGAPRSDSLENSVLCIWYSSQGKPGAEVGVGGSRAGFLFLPPPGSQMPRVWVGAGNRDSLDHPILRPQVPGLEQGSQATLSWRSGPLAPKTHTPNPTKSLGIHNLRLRIERNPEFSLLTQEAGWGEGPSSGRGAKTTSV